MVPVPKLLGKVKTWNPETILISFKLETDTQILEQKAKAAIEKYGVDMVVANELKTRRSKVIIYHSDGTSKELRSESERMVDQISENIVKHITHRVDDLDKNIVYIAGIDMKATD